MKADGYRYCRQYTTPKGLVRWALFERIEGRNHRVGTAESYDRADGVLSARAFIAHEKATRR